MKTVKFNIITPKGYIFNSFISDEGEKKVINIMYTDDVHEAQKFNAQFIEDNLALYEKAVGVKHGHGLGIPKYRTKMFIISCPKGYVYDYERDPSSYKIINVSYTADMDDAMQVPEVEVNELARRISKFINVPLFGGMGYSPVKVSYAD